jgi:hypothetical protein
MSGRYWLTCQRLGNDALAVVSAAGVIARCTREFVARLSVPRPRLAVLDAAVVAERVVTVHAQNCTKGKREGQQREKHQIRSERFLLGSGTCYHRGVVCRYRRPASRRPKRQSPSACSCTARCCRSWKPAARRSWGSRRPTRLCQSGSSIVQCCTNTEQRSAAQHSTAQHSTAQHSTAQHSTAQHSTYSTGQVYANARARRCKRASELTARACRRRKWQSMSSTHPHACDGQ